MATLSSQSINFQTGSSQVKWSGGMLVSTERVKQILKLWSYDKEMFTTALWCYSLSGVILCQKIGTVEVISNDLWCWIFAAAVTAIGIVQWHLWNQASYSKSHAWTRFWSFFIQQIMISTSYGPDSIMGLLPTTWHKDYHFTWKIIATQNTMSCW